VAFFVPHSITTTSIIINGDDYRKRDTVDHFDRLRAVQPVEGYSVYFADSLHNESMQVITTGGATQTQNNGYIRLNVSTSGDRIVKQSRYIGYKPGRTSFTTMVCTLVDTSASKNVTTKVGRFDDSVDKTVNDTGTGDGLFFQYINGTMSVVQRSSVSGSQTDTTITQANWNIDTLDGTGASAFTLNPSLLNLYVVEYLWQGTGVARFGVVRNYGVIWCHIFEDRNLSVPYMRRGSLPIRYETRSDAIGVTCSSNLTCFASVYYGGMESMSYIASVSAIEVIAATATYANLMLIRLKSTSVRTMAALTGLTFAPETAGRIVFARVYIGNSGDAVTITAGTPTWAAVETNSSLETCTNMTGLTITAGTGCLVYQGFNGGAGGIDYNVADYKNLPSNYFLTALANGTSNYILLQGRINTAGNISAALRFIEQLE
jgi:hypothetical protein